MSVGAVEDNGGLFSAPEIPAPKRLDVIARALGDETRRQLLKFVVETGNPLSGARAARALFVETKRINYQFKALEDAQLVFLADRRRVRGFTEKLFMATPIALSDPIVRAVLDAVVLSPAFAAVA